MTLFLNFKNGVYTLMDETRQTLIVSSENLSDIVNAIPPDGLISVSIDADEFFIRKVNLPAIGEEKVKEILPVEMEGKFLVPAQELCFGLVFLEKSETLDSYLVFAIKKQFLLNLLTPILNKGAKVTVVSLSNLDAISELLVGVDQEKIKGLDFYPEELKKYTEKKLAFGVLKKVVLYALAICFIIILGLSLRLYFMSKKEAQLKKSIVAGYNTIFPESKSSSPSASVIEAKLKELKQNYRSLKGIELLDILKDVSASVGNLAVKEINVETNRLTIKGEAKEYSAIEQYKGLLKKNFPLIKVTETKNLSDGRMTFVMEATIDE